jgi:hypothetical protein
MLFFGCSKFDPSYEDINLVQSEWLLPVAKTTIGFENINEISKIAFDVNVTASAMGFPTNTPVDISNLEIPFIGPYVKEMPDILNRMEYDSLLFTIDFINSFPFTINAGTRISFRNTPEITTENLLFEWIISEPTPSGALVNASAVSTSNSFDDKIYIFLENFSSDGGTGLIFSEIPLTININFEVIDINAIELNTWRDFLSVDTLSVSIEAPGDTFGVSTGGIATVYYDNQLPVNQRFQAYFLNDGEVIDSLFTSPGIIDGCQIDGNGDPTSLETTNSIAQLSWSKWTKLAQSDKMVVHHYLNTSGYDGSLIRASENCHIKLQLVVDVNISINIGEL